MEAAPTFPFQEDPRKRFRYGAAGAGDDGYASADGGEHIDLKAYTDATKDALMASVSAVQTQVQASVASSVGSRASTVQKSCGNLAQQVERRMASVEFNLSDYMSKTDQRLDTMGEQISELQRLV
ncbi:unnamed protein product, partial [Prorocentrum cordatum]